MAVDREAVWWEGGDTGNVWRVDPETGKIVSTVRVSPSASGLGEFEPVTAATGAGGVWVSVGSFGP